MVPLTVVLLTVCIDRARNYVPPLLAHTCVRGCYTDQEKQMEDNYIVMGYGPETGLKKRTKKTASGRNEALHRPINALVGGVRNNISEIAESEPRLHKLIVSGVHLGWQDCS